jgi:hypothetical protein
VVETIRKAVDVVSTYAGAALPEGGKGRSLVRSLVLRLPERYFEAADGGRRGIEAAAGGASEAGIGGMGRDSKGAGGEMVTVRLACISSSQPPSWSSSQTRCIACFFFFLLHVLSVLSLPS